MVVHVHNPSIWGARVRVSSLRPTYTTQWTPAQKQTMKPQKSLWKLTLKNDPGHTLKRPFGKQYIWHTLLNVAVQEDVCGMSMAASAEGKLWGSFFHFITWGIFNGHINIKIGTNLPWSFSEGMDPKKEVCPASDAEVRTETKPWQRSYLTKARPILWGFHSDKSSLNSDIVSSNIHLVWSIYFSSKINELLYVVLIHWDPLSWRKQL